MLGALGHSVSSAKYTQIQSFCLASCYAAQTGTKFQTEIGSAKATRPDYLRYGLWTASQLLGTSSSKATKRIMLFTNDPDPTSHAEANVYHFR